MVIASVLLALLLFLILLAVLKWNLFLCMILAAAAYAALSLIFRSEDREDSQGEDAREKEAFSAERLAQAEADLGRMEKAAADICQGTLKEECGELLRLARSILNYLREHPEKIPGARRYIDYYQETAANVLEHYTELRRTGLDTPETEKLLKQSEESIRTLRSAFQMQFEKLLQNEMMDMEADLNLLKKTLYAEGYSEPTEK